MWQRQAKNIKNIAVHKNNLAYQTVFILPTYEARSSAEMKDALVHC